MENKEEKYQKVMDYLISLEDKQDEQFVRTVEKVMEDKKYYTPSIEDIRVGYECEVWKEYWRLDINDLGYNSKINEWKPWVINSQDIQFGDSEGVTTIGQLFRTNRIPRIRTPYLSKEQIEAEGFEYIETNTLGGLRFRKLDEGDRVLCLALYPHWQGDRNILRIGYEKEEYFENMDDRYCGKCPSINEFRLINKLLGI